MVWNWTCWKINDNSGTFEWWDQTTVLSKNHLEINWLKLVNKPFYFPTPLLYKNTIIFTILSSWWIYFDKQANRRALVVFDRNCVSLCRKVVQTIFEMINLARYKWFSIHKIVTKEQSKVIRLQLQKYDQHPDRLGCHQETQYTRFSTTYNTNIQSNELVDFSMTQHPFDREFGDKYVIKVT